MSIHSSHFCKILRIALFCVCWFHGILGGLFLCSSQADRCKSKLAVFEHMKQKAIGLQTALFYQGYGLVLENENKPDLAEQIYVEGLRAKAEPMRRLQAAYERVAAKRALAQPTTDKENSDPSFLVVTGGVAVSTTKAPSTSTWKQTESAPDGQRALSPSKSQHEEMSFEELRAAFTERKAHEPTSNAKSCQAPVSGTHMH